MAATSAAACMTEIVTFWLVGWTAQAWIAQPVVVEAGPSAGHPLDRGSLLALGLRCISWIGSVSLNSVQTDSACR